MHIMIWENRWKWFKVWISQFHLLYVSSYTNWYHKSWILMIMKRKYETTIIETNEENFHSKNLKLSSSAFQMIKTLRQVIILYYKCCFKKFTLHLNWCLGWHVIFVHALKLGKERSRTFTMAFIVKAWR